jgi:UDP-glucose 4-epimerase
VTDLAEAHVLALKALEAGARTSAYNLGNGRGFSVKEVIETAAQVTGCKIPTRLGARRPGDPPCLVGDARKAIEDFGWKLRFFELPTIIETAWKWSERRWGT